MRKACKKKEVAFRSSIDPKQARTIKTEGPVLEAILATFGLLLGSLGMLLSGSWGFLSGPKSVARVPTKPRSGFIGTVFHVSGPYNTRLQGDRQFASDGAHAFSVRKLPNSNLARETATQTQTRNTISPVGAAAFPPTSDLEGLLPPPLKNP